MSLWLFVLLSLRTLAIVLPRQDGTTVDVQQGAVSGTLVTPSVRQFLGIPYAASTTGSNRFSSPQPAPAFSGSFDATSYGDSCPQVRSDAFLELVGLLQQQLSISVSENCLNLNIWAPALNRPQGGAVMIWVYGGSDDFGSSNTPLYDGQYFVENNDDLVIVTINYRLNIFGFPNSPQLIGQPSNIGFLDMDAAIEWVYANIAAFGGNPDRITIFGESAGAIMVDAYAFSHIGDTVVKGIIEESGVSILLASLTNATTSSPSPTSPWNTVAGALGCGTAGDAAQLTCMQTLPWQTVLNEVVSSNASFSPGPDGYTLFTDQSERSASGHFLKAPLLVGINKNEGDIFLVAAEQSDLGFIIPVATEILSDALTELIIACPTAQTANNRVSAGVPTYRYIYEGIFSDVNNNNPNLRAFHSSEIPLVWGTYNLSTFSYPPTQTEITLSRYMQKAWVAFAQNPSSGLENYGWPQYNGFGSPVAELGNSGAPTSAVFTPAIAFDLLCPVSNALLPLVLEIISAVGGIL